jgi:hypothetical protein
MRGLAIGVQGVTTLVCSTGYRPELFVRKTGVPGSEYRDNVTRSDIPEVVLVRDHQSIPRLLYS